MDEHAFRAIQPQFADLIAYPKAAVEFWLKVAGARLDPARWSDLLDEGTALFVAHKLALAGAAGAGSAPGAGTGGVVSSKSVGGVSIAYATGIGSIADAGAYDMTSYGREFMALARIVGMGGWQL